MDDNTININDNMNENIIRINLDTDALMIGTQLISKYPDNAEGYILVAHHYMNNNGDTDTIKIGLPYLKKAANMTNIIDLFFNYAIACRCVKLYDEAYWGIMKVLEQEPNNPQFIGHRGYVLYTMGKHDEGIKEIIRAVNVAENTSEEDRKKWSMGEKIDFVDFIKTLCEYYYFVPEHVKEATRLAEFAIDEFPEGLTKSLDKFIDHNAPVPFTTSAAITKNQIGEIYFLCGHQYQEKGDLDAAAKEYIISCEYLPHLSVPHYATAMALRFIGQHELALKYIIQATELDPTNMKYLSDYMHILKATCRWEEFDKNMVTVKKMIEDKDYENVVDFRLSAMYWEFDMELLHQLFVIYSKTLEVPKKKQCKHNKKYVLNKKLKIAYISSNFRNHAQGSQLGTFFKEHNRDEFEVYAITIYPVISDLAIERQNILKAQVDNWVDMTEKEPSEIAKYIKKANIDIVIDLCGHADHPQMEIFAYRPAPVQISFLGFPCTTGASFMDYYVGDPVSTPKTMENCFSEKLMIMPNTYQVTEHKGEHPLDVINSTKSSIKKVARTIVFCNFNQPVKIDHKIFTVWMNILKKVKNGVLWLLDHPAVDRMREEALKQGVEPNRLIFQSPVGKREHLLRMKTADLLLDTTIYNSHTSAGDALWAGLPILTLLGDTMQSRVCSSMVTAAGFPEMIVNSLEEYENRAVYLATHVKELKKLRKNVEVARENMKLFDTPGFVKDFEKGLKETWKQFVTTKKFESFNVADL